MWAAIAMSLVGAFAVPAASAASSAKVTGPGTGPQPAGLGMGSSAALGQKTCNPNGRTSFNTVGGGPFCVNPWPAGKNNGGATAPGVTATSVKVVLYVANSQGNTSTSGTSAPMNLATGATGTPDAAISDFLAMYNYANTTLGTYQLWGRKPDIQIVTASGQDEASQRADAVTVVNMKPFMVFDTTGISTGGAAVFSTAVASKKIVVFSASTTPELGAKLSPYMWNFGADPQAGGPLAAAFVGKTLSGGKAQYAGDPAFQSKKRTFGVVYPSSGFDLAAFQASAKSNGATIAQAVSFDPTDASTFSQQVPTMINKLKSSGITSVILFTPPTFNTPLTKEATSQSYSPEWVTTGYQYQDFDAFARLYDQDQWSHAFGMSVLYPYVDGTPPAYINPYTWYFGPNNATTWGNITSSLALVWPAMQYAGPTLTAANMKKGFFSVPAQGGAATGTNSFQAGYGDTVGMPYPEYAQIGTDFALAWYSATATVPSQVVGGAAKGGALYLDNAKRYSYKSVPTSTPKFFDTSNSVATVPLASSYVGGQVPAASPCTGCPSQGKTS